MIITSFGKVLNSVVTLKKMASRANNSKHPGLATGFQMHNWTEITLLTYFRCSWFPENDHIVYSLNNAPGPFCFASEIQNATQTNCKKFHPAVSV